MKKEKPAIKKSEKLKFWGTIIVAVLGTYGTIMSTIIQATSAKESSLNVMVNQLNSIIIPKLQEIIDDQGENINKLRDQNSYIRERLAKLEAVFETYKFMLRNFSIFPTIIDNEIKSKESKEIEKDTKQKRSLLPKLDISEK